MERPVLTDTPWAKMAPHGLGKPSDPGRSGGDNQPFVEAVLWMARTGSPWRERPAGGRRWNTAVRRSRDRVKADALGHLVRLVLLPGHRSDSIGGPPPIEDVAFDGLSADKAFDSNAPVAELSERGAKVVIPRHPARSQPLPIDLELCKWRHPVENLFCRPKAFRRGARRAGTTDQSLQAMTHLAAAATNSR